MSRQILTNSAQGSRPGTVIFDSFGKLSEQWRGLVYTGRGANLYHSERWLKVLKAAYGFSFRVAMLEREGTIEAAIIFARVHRPLALWWVSLPFSDSCPPLSFGFGGEAALLAQLQRQYANERFEVRGATIPLPWRSVECFLAWSMDMSAGLPKLYRSLATNFRRNIVKARKYGIRVEHGSTLAQITRFYWLHSSGRRRLGLPCQALSFFRKLGDVFGGDLDIWLASRQGNDVATIFTIADGDTLYYKWVARNPDDASGAGHLLFWSMVEQCAGRFRTLDLGRSDRRNTGLNRFKHDSGGQCRSLPYVFFPTAPDNPSSELLQGKKRLFAKIWRRLPAAICRAIERYVYGYLS
ncbi:MAG: GNAT family N-acetyltransferase [Deltaproteobacteria bacterium]|nr:GNAT family N-acetyltransferase [Deltaproteobacteria bacterium]